MSVSTSTSIEICFGDLALQAGKLAFELPRLGFGGFGEFGDLAGPGFRRELLLFEIVHEGLAFRGQRGIMLGFQIRKLLGVALHGFPINRSQARGRVCRHELRRLHRLKRRASSVHWIRRRWRTLQ